MMPPSNWPPSPHFGAVSFTDVPQALMHIERELAVGEPSSVRAQVFRLLYTGRLMAPALRTSPLSLLTEFQATHATTTH